jgi:membrane associated rhomboid family serine protease
MKELTQTLKNQAWILGAMVGTMWVVTILDTFIFRHQLRAFGIIPHNFVGLRGILFAPLLHANFTHLISNTVPFVTLGWLIMLWETSDLLVVTAITMLVGGLGTWLFGGANTVHVGASGVIFGYLGYLLFRGYFERKLSSIIMSLFVFAAYGSVLFGLLPGMPGISWQGHLFGFLGGAIAANLASQK